MTQSEQKRLRLVFSRQLGAVVDDLRMGGGIAGEECSFSRSRRADEGEIAARVASTKLVDDSRELGTGLEMG